LHPVACVRSRWGGFIPSTQRYYADDDPES
jgi:hypothetical protein